MATSTAAAAEIARCNDAFRRCLGLVGPQRPKGRTLVARGLAAVSPAALERVLHAVAAFEAFTPDNDPYGEHDCAILTVEGARIIWKIDYYEDADCKFGAEDPARDCYRVLMIMLAEEY